MCPPGVNMLRNRKEGQGRGWYCELGEIDILRDIYLSWKLKFPFPRVLYFLLLDMFIFWISPTFQVCFVWSSCLWHGINSSKVVYTSHPMHWRSGAENGNFHFEGGKYVFIFKNCISVLLALVLITIGWGSCLLLRYQPYLKAFQNIF